MNSSNSLQASQGNKISFSSMMATPSFQRAISNSIRDTKQANRFIASITSAVAVNPNLQECVPSTILSGALLGESLGLVPSPQLGQFYLVPYKQKEKKDRNGRIISPECTVAQFQIGYKGYIQLALRSGYYKKLNVMEVKEGEFGGFNPFTEDIQVTILDWDAHEKAPTVGYCAFFEYLNGFRKTIYWTKEKMLAHADRYSKAFSRIAYGRLMNGEIPDDEMWKYSSFWYTDFDGMARKTMLRQLISKWGMMSTELQKAFEMDDSINDLSAAGNIVSVPDDAPAALSETPAVPMIAEAAATEAPTAESIRYANFPTSEKAPAGRVSLDDL